MPLTLLGSNFPRARARGQCSNRLSFFKMQFVAHTDARSRPRPPNPYLSRTPAVARARTPPHALSLRRSSPRIRTHDRKYKRHLPSRYRQFLRRKHQPCRFSRARKRRRRRPRIRSPVRTCTTLVGASSFPDGLRQQVWLRTEVLQPASFAQA